jgi:hypothetical protein
MGDNIKMYLKGLACGSAYWFYLSQDKPLMNRAMNVCVRKRQEIPLLGEPLLASRVEL